MRYLLAREGVYCTTGGPACLTHQAERELLIRILCITTLHGINKSVRIKIKCTFYTIISLFFWILIWTSLYRVWKNGIWLPQYRFILILIFYVFYFYVIFWTIVIPSVQIIIFLFCTIVLEFLDVVPAGYFLESINLCDKENK